MSRGERRKSTSRYNATYLVDLFVGELITSGDILPSHGLIHVGLDGAWGHCVDGDLFVAGVDSLDLKPHG